MLTDLAERIDRTNEYERVVAEHLALLGVGDQIRLGVRLMDVARCFAENLSDLRSEAGISQEDLGFLAGLHRTEISLL